MHREPTLHSKALTNPLMHECETFFATIAQFNTPLGYWFVSFTLKLKSQKLKMVQYST